MDFCYLEGATFRGARVKKTIFPINRISSSVMPAEVRKLTMDNGRLSKLLEPVPPDTVLCG